jgi:hypothetical protein
MFVIFNIYLLHSIILIIFKQQKKVLFKFLKSETFIAAVAPPPRTNSAALPSPSLVSTTGIINDFVPSDHIYEAVLLSDTWI